MSYKDFTYQQKCFILKHYKEYTYPKIGEMLGLKSEDIYAFIHSEGLRKASKKQPNIWTEQEIEFLKENFNIYSRRVLAKRLSKTENNIRTKIIELKLVEPGKRKKYLPIDVKPHKRNVFLNKEQEDFLIKNFNKISCEDLGNELNISAKQVREYAICVLKLQKFGHIPKFSFNYYELKTLKEFYGLIPPREICKLIPNKTWKQIQRKANQMKLSIIRMTFPERKVCEILDKHNIKYECQVKHYFGEKLYIADFEINKLIIEVQGDYWHGNPNRYSKEDLNELQLKMIERDKIKKQCFENIGYTMFYVWEFDLHQNIKYCENQILDICKKFLSK